ncbi:restriction endonuclease subunit S [Streptococcus pseudopneumoniae]|uniref:restriction endonuclease subunit S n=1 Tax=Streptococcus pseudopneumoniae TaxID=257758 RepID=UPI0014869E79|nr:restriction endonuclease subunit S [Streptococcus pseudopneumoniae]
MTPEQLKASILQRAMEGKLVPQNPNDEPASELLKRIKAEKEKLISEGKIKRDKKETEIFRGDDGKHYEKFADGSAQEIDVPYDIPENWEWVRLENITRLINDGTHSTPHYTETGIPFLSVRDISSGTLDFSNTKYISVEEHAILSKRTKPEMNDILLSKVGTTGIPVKVDTDKEFSIFVSLALLKFTSSIDVDFMVHLIKSPVIFKQSKLGTRGVGNKNLVLQTIKNFLFPLPPLSEQQRIVEAIESALEKVDEYAESYNRLEQLDKEFPDKLKKSILQYAMQGKLVEQDPNDEPVEVLLEKIRSEKQKLFEEGKIKKKDLEISIVSQGDDNSYYEEVPYEIPKSWEWVRFSTLVEIVRGGSPRPIKDYLTSEVDGINWIKIGDTEKGEKYINNVKEKIKKSGLNKTRFVKKGTFLLTNSMSFGRPYILNVDGAIHDGWLAISNYENSLNRDYLFYILSSNVVYSQFLSLISGAVVKNLNSDKVASILIPLPPLPEQSRIVDKIEQFFAHIDALI